MTVPERRKQSPNRDLASAQLRDYDLVTLRLLLRAFEEGNLARVAATENISLSAVSRRISDFEARIGVKLLHRHDRGVAPTAEARANLGRLRALSDLVEQLAESFRAIREGETGVVRLRAHLTAIAGALPGVIAEFTGTHDGINLLVDEGTSSDIVHAVQLGDCDIGFVSGTVDTADLQVFSWKTDQLMVVMPIGHPLAAQKAIRFADTVEYPFIGLSQGSALQRLFRAQAAALGRTMNEQARVSTFEGVRHMVSAGLGVGILPGAFASRSPAVDRLLVRRLDEDWATRPLVICVRDRAQLSSTAHLFLGHLLTT